MLREMSRRSFITSASTAGAAVWLNRSAGAWLQNAQASPKTTMLQANTRTLEINGKAASLMGLSQASGKQGLALAVEQPFLVRLENKLLVPTAIHWHGLHPPNSQDGVPGLTQNAVAPNASADYDFPTRPSGTHWMHSHQGLQEAFLLSAPLIVHDPTEEHADEQEVILFLGDFSFTPPREIFAQLHKPSATSMAMSGTKTPKAMKMDRVDANDVDYDAYLANDRILADPEVVPVERRGKVRLRIINGSSGTNFFIDLGELKGELIATDGMPVRPLSAAQFPLAIAQRIDLRVQLPGAGSFPILAHRENAIEQAGIILATRGALIAKVPLKKSTSSGLLNLAMEAELAAATPLAAKPIDQDFDLHLQGNMTKYSWSINGIVFDVAEPRTQTPQVKVRKGQRVALNFINDTAMSHPMHLHGHSFQVIEINGKALNGALRDTILVTPRTSVKVAFDADNPGTWYVHCHVLWHLAAGMATLVQYEAA